MPPGLVSCIPAKALRNYLLFSSLLTASLTINGHMATGLTLSLPILPCLALSYRFSFPLMNDSFLISVQIDILNTSSLGLAK